MDSAASSSIGPASSSRSASISVNAPVPQENGKKVKARAVRINEEGVRILDKWAQNFLHSGQLHNLQDRRDIVEAVKAVGNPHYKLSHLSRFITKRKVAQRVAKKTGSEEEILFPTIDKEILAVLRWLHSRDSQSFICCAADFGLDEKELVAYVQYLNETNKGPNCTKRHVPLLDGLLPSISAVNKDKIRRLFNERPDVSDIIAQMWGHRIGVRPSDAVLFVHCLRVAGKKRKRPGSISIPESNTLIENTHLPTPTLSTSPEPHSPLLSRCTPDNQGPAHIAAALPYEPNYSNSISFLPSPESTPACRAAVLSQRSPSPLVNRYYMPVESPNTISTSAVPQSPRGSAFDSPLFGIQDLPCDVSLEEKELRTHSVPPITRLVTDLSSPSQINSCTITPVPAVSQSTSGSTSNTEEDQLADDGDDGMDMRTAGFHADLHLPTANLMTTLVIETPSMPSVELDDESAMEPRIDHAIADITTEADILWIPPIHKTSSSLPPSPLYEVTSPTTAQGLLDNISLYEGLLDDLIAMVDAAAQSTG